MKRRETCYEIMNLRAEIEVNCWTLRNVGKLTYACLRDIETTVESMKDLPEREFYEELSLRRPNDKLHCDWHYSAIFNVTIIGR